MNESVIYIYHLYMHALMEDDLFLKPRSFIHCCFVLRRYEKEWNERKRTDPMILFPKIWISFS